MLGFPSLPGARPRAVGRGRPDLFLAEGAGFLRRDFDQGRISSFATVLSAPRLTFGISTIGKRSSSVTSPPVSCESWYARRIGMRFSFVHPCTVWGAIPMIRASLERSLKCALMISVSVGEFFMPRRLPEIGEFFKRALQVSVNP